VSQPNLGIVEVGAAADAVEINGGPALVEIDGGPALVEIAGQQGTTGPPGPPGGPGPPGDPGPQGIPGEPSPGFQQYFATPLLQWVINHNLDAAFPAVVTIDLYGVPYEGDVSWPDRNTVIVDWYQPFAGTARITA
jgi:hypothetical protein